MAKSPFSLPAWVIISSHIVLSRSTRWGKLVPAENLPFYLRCSRYCCEHFITCRLLNLLPGAAKLKLIDKTVAYGASQHFLLRKQAIAQQVKDSIERGARQLVVLGAGFDLVAYNTARAHAGVDCFEIDTPGMHIHKQNILMDCYGNLPVNFHALGADLSQQPLSSVLTAANGFDANKPTLFVAEGLTMYLKEAEVKKLFEDIRQLTSVTVSAVFTAIESHHEMGSQTGKRIRDVFLASNDEKFSWSIPQSKMAGFLLSAGFAQQYLLSYADLQKPLRTAQEMDIISRQTGEYIVYAVANRG